MRARQPRAFITPSLTAVVPSDLRELWQPHVARQGCDDSACGLFALITAAGRLLPVSARKDRNAIVEGLGASRARIESNLSVGSGVFARDLRSLARSAGLTMDVRPNIRKVGQFREPGRTWIAHVNALTSEVSGHWVLVVGATDGALVIVDPYPGNPDMYCVDEGEFDAGWRAPKKTARSDAPRGNWPWAAALRATR